MDRAGQECSVDLAQLDVPASACLLHGEGPGFVVVDIDGEIAIGQLAGINAGAGGKKNAISGGVAADSVGGGELDGWRFDVSRFIAIIPDAASGGGNDYLAGRL